MGQSAATEAIIAIASRLKDHVSGLYKAYLRLPEVIQKEHEAIKTGSLAAVEHTCEEKTKIGEDVEVCFNAMRQASEELKSWRRRLMDVPAKNAVTLRDCVDILDELAEHLITESFSVQVLKHQNQGLRALIHEFETQYKRAQPLIEMNKYLTERMLLNHQESYRFWLSIIEETESAYNAQGMQKAQGRHSAFKVTA